jgi:lysophospholipase L1-like esterase
MHRVSSSLDSLADVRTGRYHDELVAALKDQFFSWDLEPPAQSVSWTLKELMLWFETGGQQAPVRATQRDACARSPPNSPPSLDATLVCIYGDSLVSGWLPVGCEGNTLPRAAPFGKVTESVLRELTGYSGLRVISHGSPGWTARQMVDKIAEPATGLRRILSRRSYDVVIILAGINDFLRNPVLVRSVHDSDLLKGFDGQALLDSHNSDQATQHAEAQARGSLTVALGLLPTEHLSAEHAGVINSRIEAEVGASLFLSSSDLLPFSAEHFCADGLHPNREGYTAFGSAIGKRLYSELPLQRQERKQAAHRYPPGSPEAW